MNKYISLLLSAATILLLGTTGRLAAQTSVDSVVTSNLFEPYGVASVSDGSFFLTDAANNRILRVANGATVGTLLAGQTGIAGSNDGYANIARFYLPQGIVIARGGLIVADSGNHTLRFVTFSGVVTNLAGAPGVYGSANGSAFAARFRYPLGLAADSDGNIYIADSQNNAVRKLDTNNNVTTIATGLFQPAGVALGENGDVWVTDTRRHCIKIISTNGVVTLVAGIPGASGQDDSLVATNAQFSSPRALLWVSPASGMLVSDSGNHTIRRVYWNTNFNNYSVETFAGVPGTTGAQNGPALSSTFNSPIGLAFDEFSGGFLVVDKGNNQVRRINTGVVQNPVSEPTIGWVDFAVNNGYYVSVLRPVISSVFNNDVIIAIRGEFGTQTYYTIGETPTNPLEDSVPEPSAGSGNTPPHYRDGLFPPEVPDSISPPLPDITVKAIGTQPGRRSSAVVRSRFIFQVANPSIIGDNAASFQVFNATTNAEMWYTWDGSDPTNNPLANTNVIGPVINGDTISFNLNNTNHTFKIRAYRRGYRPSDISTKVFKPENFEANKISLGFATGEASSEFVAAAGQRFYAPVTLSLLPAQSMYSLQFNVVVTNETGLPVDSTQVGFRNGLEYPHVLTGDQVGPDGQPYILIPPSMVVGVDTNNDLVLGSLLIRDPSINLLGVGWLERKGVLRGIYPANQQDLISFSQVHDTVFRSADGKVVVGGYSFVVPAGTPDGSTYRIQLGRASATSDGVSKDVYIQIPTNGSLTMGAINGTKRVTVGSRRYIVGDVAPFRWFNAGDFGDTNLLNNDVLQVFQSTIYQWNLPPIGSDFFDAMDSSDGTVSDLFNGNIDQIQYGDGVLNVDDIYVTFRRSLDPSLKWYARSWSGGIRQAIEVPNSAPQYDAKAKAASPRPKVVFSGTPTVVISADDIIGAPGATVQVPVRVHITGGLPIRVAALGLTVQALDGSPVPTTPLSLSPASGLGTPAVQNSLVANRIGAAWLNDNVTGVSGDGILATLSFTIPPDAVSNAAYRLHIDHFSASENGIALFKQHVYDGLVTLANRSTSSWGDGISDTWRLRYFGSVSDLRSTASADPDGDGVSNLIECRAGTNPLDGGSSLRLNGTALGGSALKLTFPTGPGHNYVIECAPALNGPWSPISTNLGDGGVREFTHSAEGNRFYRVQAQ